MCVDKKKFKCLCGCSMTQSTVIFGVVLILGGLSSLGVTGGVGFMGAFQVIIGIIMLTVTCNAKSIQMRKIIYYAFLVYTILLFLSLIVVIILILAVDSVIGGKDSDCSGDDFCDGAHDAVDDAARFFLIIVVVIWAAIYVPITLIGLQITYWGWKESEYREKLGCALELQSSPQRCPK